MAKAEAQCQVLRERASIAATAAKTAEAEAAAKAEAESKPRPEAVLTNDELRQWAEEAKRSLVVGWLYPDEISLFYAHPGVGKSMLLQHLAIQHAKSGDDAFTLYYDYEMDDRKRAYGERMGAKGFLLSINGKFINGKKHAPDIKSFLASVSEYVRNLSEMGFMRIVCIIDHLMALDERLNLSGPAEMLKTGIADVKKLATEKGVTLNVVYVAHGMKEDRGDLRDVNVHSSLTANVTQVFRLRRLTSNTRLLIAEKDTNGEVPPLTVLIITDDKPYVRMEEANKDGNLHRLLNSKERIGLISALADLKGMKLRQEEIGKLVGLNKSNVCRQLKYSNIAKKGGKHKKNARKSQQKCNIAAAKMQQNGNANP